MNTVQTDLTIVGAHTPTPSIYWKGQQVPNVAGLKVLGGIVTLTLQEDSALSEMMEAGIKIVRV